MPGLNGMEAAGQITRKYPQIGVVILSMHQASHYRANRGNQLAFGRLLEHVSAGAGPQAAQNISLAPKDSFELLTAREREVLQMIAEGNSNKQIAGPPFLNTFTVETHLKKIVEKLGLHGTADLILDAVRKGMIS